MANIKLNNNEYPIPDSKLAGPRADLIAHLGTIAGNGVKVVIGGVEYSVDAAKVAGAIAGLEDYLVEAGKPKPSEGLAYTLNSDGVSYSVAKGTCTDTDVVIASEYEGCPVTGIASDAFRDCANLTSVVIPTSVTSIDHSAFYGCSLLTNITIPDSVTFISAYAFFKCKSLVNITIPNSIASIFTQTFSGCTSLRSVTLPNSIICIGNSAFSSCNSLTSITIPNSVASIEQYAFAFSLGLQTIIFNGTMEQWNIITKQSNWNKNIPATYVQCSDGQVAF